MYVLDRSQKSSMAFGLERVMDCVFQRTLTLHMVKRVAKRKIHKLRYFFSGTILVKLFKVAEDSVVYIINRVHRLTSHLHCTLCLFPHIL